MGAAQTIRTNEAEELRALAWRARPPRRVELAYTQFGPGLLGVKAYHTSVILQDREYSFGRLGVVQAPPFASHSFLSREHQLMVLGHTTLTGEEMAMVLHPYFAQGTYDMIHKNCNSFTDAALYLLLGQRLNPAFRDLERAGFVAERAFNFVQAITGGTYRPNPAASKFDAEHVIARILDDKRRMGLK